MPGFLPSVYTVSALTAASVTSAIELAGAYNYVYLVVPSMAAGYGADTKIFLQASFDGTTYYRMAEVLTNSVANDFSIATSVTQRVVYLPNFAARYVKVETTAVVTSQTSIQPFKFICVP